MKIILVNGSPRKNWNTAKLLAEVAEGAVSRGMSAETVHLYDYTFKGCGSCFSCKVKNPRHPGHCAQKDALTPILENILAEADALVLGAPIYFGSMSGGMRCFFERLLFPAFPYTRVPTSLFPRVIPSAFVYTMNAPEDAAKARGYNFLFEMNENWMKVVFGRSSRSFQSFDTLQFPDYDRFVADRYDAAAKVERNKTVFPEDCRRARQLGETLAEEALAGASR